MVHDVGFASPTAQLVVFQGRVQKGITDLDTDSLSIGRQEENDLVLESDRVSRRHAKVLRENGGYFIEDLGSFNGTLVNNRRLTPCQKRKLRHKDILQLSDCRLLFLDHNDLATQLSIHLDRDLIAREAAAAVDEFLGRDRST
jgi:pSer/pThr/pTyr-binding forkhead associated (FHA) protein